MKRNCVIICWPQRKPRGLKDKNVGLYLSPFVGKRPTEPEHHQHNIKILVDNEAWKQAIADGKLEITLAYTFSLFSLSDEWSTLRSPISEQCLSKAKAMVEKLDDAFRIVKLDQDPHLNFLLWRNVEHILSVCSIPTGDQPSSEEFPRIALTCGDIANHRVTTKASL